MDIQNLIYTEVKEARKDIQNLCTRVTAVEIELRSQGKKVERLNGCSGEMAGELDELSGAVECLEKRHWSRKEKLAIWGLICGWGITIALFVLEVTLG